jgi:hypothetical protein
MLVYVYCPDCTLLGPYDDLIDRIPEGARVLTATLEQYERERRRLGANAASVLELPSVADWRD